MNGYVVAANAAVWIFLAGYAIALCLRGRSISNRLQHLETLRDGHDR
ncbi:CcmD family protein [Humidesulfovibrio mexicanus]|uniref:CcmD family protein n=1 Tax=Humidesulfovibrio mexicanus TaxID=147047 RepID=A0A239B0L4_9BACT|nr:CcmD family protein [Humidesulfovibrio mexicanus]